MAWSTRASSPKLKNFAPLSGAFTCDSALRRDTWMSELSPLRRTGPRGRENNVTTGPGKKRGDGGGVVLVDSANCHFFINSSLAAMLVFRRRLSFVCDVLKGITAKGYTTARWQALMLRWSAVCWQGPVGPILSLDPWKDWLPPDLHGFYKWAFCCFCRSLNTQSKKNGRKKRTVTAEGQGSDLSKEF